MTEQEYYNALIALGCLDVTSNRQRSNGTTAFATPTGHVISEHKTGYIRRNMYREGPDMGAKGYYGGGKCYQLNPMIFPKPSPHPWKTLLMAQLI